MSHGITHTYVIMAHSVHVILQMAFSIIGKYNSTQFPISSKVESSIGGKHKQTCDVPPADLILIQNTMLVSSSMFFVAQLMVHER